MKIKNMKSLFSKSMSKNKWAAVIVTFVVLITAISFVTYEGTKKTVALTIDGEEQVIKTHAKTIADILKSLDIDTRSEDYLSPAAKTKVKEGMSVVLEPAKQVDLAVGNEERTVWTTAKTIQELLTQEKIKVGEHDEITPNLDEEISNNMKIAIEYAFPLTLVDGQQVEETWSTSTTVADFLKKHDVTLNELDRLNLESSYELKPHDKVEIVRVEKVTDVVEEPTDFSVVTKKEDTMDQGTEKVVQQGENGIKKNTFEIVKENGQEVSRKLVKEETVKDSTDKIVAVGTKPVVSQVSRGATTNAAAEGNEFYMDSTAYTSYCNGCSGVTATGINLRENPGLKVVAVDPSVIPLGSKVHVEGYGYAVAGDTGGAIKGNKIDVFIPDKTQAYRWGVKKVKVKVIE
ncbi:G5 and 3D domain-containing protein [Bacillus chungangensis]|uniref:Uncharacterized protein YabE (DUF348 family) n=1 Tax=Bacillus chungangensis TaxID=587633 RepID=A0ABT9WYT2_9BACI|nr:G5 and 3D domain-containing protein [Bacillus chungangensis]MDQ0177915.1 uncharacterized protein YabE (DUF348 family) [Bacillus chungangensis]